MQTITKKRKSASERVGERFGKWTITGTGFIMGNHRWFCCACRCGFTSLVPIGNLLTGKSRRCMRCRNRGRGE